MSKKISIYLNDTQLEILKPLLEETGLRKSTLIKMIIKDYILKLNSKEVDISEETQRLKAL